MGTTILGVSILLQFAAAAVGLRHIFSTGHKLGWGCVAFALTLMGVRRSITFFDKFPESSFTSVDVTTEYVALTISLLMLTGVVLLGRMFAEEKRVQRTLASALEIESAASKSKSEFLSRMSHELRTPLNAIMGFAQILELNMTDKAKKTDDDEQTHVGHILDASQHVLKLINEVLDLARIEAGKTEVDITPTDLDSIVDQCVEWCSGPAVQRNIEVIVRLGETDEGIVLCDELRLKQVLLNLLTNATKYNKDGGTITLSTSRTDDGYLYLSVEDTGEGIAKSDHHKVFEMFSRLAHDNDLSLEGAGIGLAMSKALIERMGGEIGFASELGRGSTFWIKLQVAPAGSLAPSAKSAA